MLFLSLGLWLTTILFDTLGREEFIRELGAIGVFLIKGLGRGLGLIPSLLISRVKQSSKSFFESKTELPTWINGFLSDEEKEAILIDCRINWYGKTQPTKWIHFKVWLKTMHYLFYEVSFKEGLDKIKSFQIKVSRW